MNILNMEHITKVYGDKVIFDDISVGIHQGDKIGIIGINGTGKTTFLRILAGLEEADEGQVIRQNGLRLSYLSQHPQFPEGATILSYVSEGKRETDWNPETDAHMVLNKLGIADHEEEIEHLSGGQKKRVALARVLINPTDLLILDEPTNHLDNSKFLEMKAEREEMEMASERKRQSVLRMEMEWAKRGCRARTTKQRARLERLEALKNGAAPVRDKSVEIDSVETRMGKKTIELHHISKSFGEKICIRDFDYIVLKNQRLGIIGPNGCGKSTLLKIIAGLLEPDSGYVETGETIRMGYFSQEIEEMNTSQRVIDYIKDVAEFIPTKDGLISAAKLLEQFLFDSSMQYAPIEKLSGGEKKRLYLLKILAAAPNVLLLDEITNDIDIPTLTILEDYLDSFAGIVIAVSHDRYFLDNLADRIFEFDREGNLTQYEGGYTDYLESKKRRFGDTAGGALNSENKNRENSSGKTGNQAESVEKESVKTWKQNRTTKLKFSFKEQREYETIDEDIAKLESKIEKLDADIMANATNSGKLNELTKEKEEAEALLEEKMDRWVYLNDLAERIEAQNNG